MTSGFGAAESGSGLFGGGGGAPSRRGMGRGSDPGAAGLGATEAVQRVAASLGVSPRYVTDTRPLSQDTRHMRGLQALSRSVSPQAARLPGY